MLTMFSPQDILILAVLLVLLVVCLSLTVADLRERWYNKPVREALSSSERKLAYIYWGTIPNSTAAADDLQSLQKMQREAELLVMLGKYARGLRKAQAALAFAEKIESEFTPRQPMPPIPPSLQIISTWSGRKWMG